ncbi:cell adhesion molecule 3 isoform X2 [Ambystoma mexicanum]|uniref:cell adhesion molecule 3 isoform X2 n=1 Tax=Ambystoma mexicanum TaxID=8296 RepID=UPI0037E8F6FA
MTNHPILFLLWAVACMVTVSANPSYDGDAKQPRTSDESVVVGGKVTLKCMVEDHDNSSLQWSNPAQQTLYFGDKKALRDNRIELVKSTSNELTISISDVGLFDEGVYTCAIFTMPVLMAKALVTVLGKPQKPLILGNEASFNENEKAKLTCKTSGSKPAAKISWYKGLETLPGAVSELIEDTDRRTFTVTSQIEFPVTQEDNGAAITCTVAHESLQNTFMSTSVKIKVYYKPVAKIESQPQFPREGENLQLRCLAYGNPSPQTYIWEKEGGELPPQSRQQENNLVFLFLNKSDTGVYKCKVSSLMGTFIAKHILDVNDPSPVPSTSSIDHAVIGGVVAVIVFLVLCLLIVLGRYLIRHKGTYLTHEAKGSDDAPDADTAIINAEGGQSSSDDKKEYFI